MRKETTTYTCDLDGGEVTATRHRLELDGTAVEIDLCAEHLDGLRFYLEYGRVVKRRPAPRRKPSRDRSAAIRAWAVQRGLVAPGSRGRMPDAVVAQAEKALNGGRR